MPGIDPKSVSVLKEAKNGGEVFFAMVVKSPAIGQLIANKTGKVPDKQIETAKSECGSNTVVKGRCSGTNGTLTFQTVKEVGATGESLGRKLVKDAGVSQHCEFVTNANAENDQPSTGSTSTGGTTTVQGGKDKSGELHDRLGVLLEALKSLRGNEAMQGTVQRAVPVAKLANEALKSGNLGEAETKIVLLEKYLNLGPSGGQTQPQTQPQSTGGDGKSGELHDRLGVVIKALNSLKGNEVMQGTVQRSLPVAKLANEALKTGDLVEAEKKIVLLENYLNIGPTGGGETPPTPTTPTTQTTSTSQTTPTTRTTPTTQSTPTSQTPPTTQTTPSQTTPTTQQPRTPPPRPTTPPPSRPGRRNFDQAKQGLDNHKLNPNAGWTSQEGRLAIQNLKQEMSKLVTDELDSEDDIKRKGTFFDSKDESYKKNVTKVVTETMNAIRPALTDPTQDTGGAIKTLDDAMGLLAIQRSHYADVRGIKDSKMLDQRKRKVEAIDKHVGEMKKINGKLRDVLKLKMKPAHDLLNSLPALNTEDPQQGDAAMKEFAKLLGEDEQMRKDLFQSAGPEHCEALEMLLRNSKDQTDKWCRELALSRASDPEFMDPMCKTVILAESKDLEKGTFFRLSTMATKLSSTYAQNSPGGKAYCQKAIGRYGELTKGKGTLELDKDKDPSLKDKDIEKNAQVQTQMIGEMVDDMTQDPESVPPEMAKLCKIYYDEALRISDNDEEFATTQSGGFMMLRVVIPSLTTESALEVNEINDKYNEEKKQAKEKWIKSGKDVKNFKPPEMSSSDKKALEKIQEKQRLITLQTKVLQNMSNGVEAGEKEPYMAPMNGAVKQGNQWAPPTVKLRGFLKNVAKRGG